MKSKNLLVSIILLTVSFFFIHCAPRNSLSQMNFGIKAAEKQLWDEAIFRWKKVIELNPASAAAHNNLAVAYEKKAQWEDARREYQRALELDPDNEHIQSNYKNFQSNHSMSEDEGNKENEKSRNIIQK